MNKEVKRRRDKRIRELGGYTSDDMRRERENWERANRRNDLNVMNFGIQKILSPFDQSEVHDIERNMKWQLIDDVLGQCPQAVKLIWKEDVYPGHIILAAKIKIVVEE